ncbi:MAG: glycosyltransferase family 9 protein [Ignavibacteria bacterium]|nr:glycosyltransferase family 9 protein [Ignavibacteria bacterium]
MSQFEILPLVEKYYPAKLFVKIFVWVICKVLRYKRVFAKSNTGHVSIIALHKIGDSIFTTHAIKKIIEFHQDKIISIICFPETKTIFKIAFPSIEIVTIPHNLFWKSRIATRRAKKVLLQTHSEIIYDLTGAITSATLIASSRAKKIVGMNLEYFKPLYDNYIPIRKSPHLIDIYMDVVRMVVPIGDNLDYEFPLKPNNSSRILIHPHAGWTAKEWGIDKYFELAKKLLPQYNVEFIIETNSLPAEIRNEIQKKFKLTETKSVEELIENIRDCAAFIGNDSGSVHIASFLGRQTFAIYGPTNPKYCRPFGNYHSTIRHEVSCSPVIENYCFTDAGRKCPSFDCMKLLKVETVYDAIVDFLKKERIFS